MSQNVLFQCLVLDTQDPLMLGRIRGTLLIDNYQDIIKGFNDPPWNEETDAWSKRDPFIFTPLLPYFVYQVPKNGELVQVLYTTLPDENGHPYINQYYVQSNFYSPTSSFYQYFEGANKFTGTGFQIKEPRPLRNRDGSYTEKGQHKGVFPEPNDVAVLGRNSADLILKDNEVLLRAGKFTSPTLEPNVIPQANTGRGFLQITRFGSTLVEKEPKFLRKITKSNLLVKYLIEYVVIIPENEIIDNDGSVSNRFTGAVYLYQLKADKQTTSGNLSAGSIIPGVLKKLVITESFIGLTKPQTIEFINAFINRMNSFDTTRLGRPVFQSTDPNSGNSDKFPIYYRPNFFMYSVINPRTNKNFSDKAIKNATEIYNGIKLKPSVKESGYGLIWKKDEVGEPLDIKKQKVPQIEYNNTPSTYSALASDKLFLISHNSAIPGKKKITLSNSLYGIPTETFTNDVVPNTSSMVRGEELIELINLIVKFLITHTHAYPNLPPDDVTQEGTTTTDILNEMQNAAKKILNSDIRLN